MSEYKFEQDLHKDYLFAEAKLGIEVEAFLATDVGRYIQGRAKLEIQDIQDQLLTIPSWQSGLATTLQQKANSLQKLMEWLSEAVDNGRGSEERLAEADEQ